MNKQDRKIIEIIKKLNKNNLNLIYDSVSENIITIAEKLDFTCYRARYDKANEYECQTFGCILGQLTGILPKEFVDKHIITITDTDIINFPKFGYNILSLNYYENNELNSSLFAYLFGSSWSLTNHSKVEQVESFCERIDLLVTAIESKKYDEVLEQINKFLEVDTCSLINEKSIDIIDEVMIK